jgi:hypothetical protein
MKVCLFNKFDVTDDNWGEIVDLEKTRRIPKEIKEYVRKHGAWENICYLIYPISRKEKV